MAQSLGLLAQVLRDQGLLVEAETSLRKAIAIQRQVRGNDHPELGYSLNTLGALLIKQGNLGARSGGDFRSRSLRSGRTLWAPNTRTLGFRLAH